MSNKSYYRAITGTADLCIRTLCSPPERASRVPYSIEARSGRAALQAHVRGMYMLMGYAGACD